MGRRWLNGGGVLCPNPLGRSPPHTLRKIQGTQKKGVGEKPTVVGGPTTKKPLPTLLVFSHPQKLFNVTPNPPIPYLCVGKGEKKAACVFLEPTGWGRTLPKKQDRKKKQIIPSLPGGGRRQVFVKKAPPQGLRREKGKCKPPIKPKGLNVGGNKPRAINFEGGKKTPRQKSTHHQKAVGPTSVRRRPQGGPNWGSQSIFFTNRL